MMKERHRWKSGCWYCHVEHFDETWYYNSTHLLIEFIYHQECLVELKLTYISQRDGPCLSSRDFWFSSEPTLVVLAAAIIAKRIPFWGTLIPPASWIFSITSLSNLWSGLGLSSRRWRGRRPSLVAIDRVFALVSTKLLIAWEPASWMSTFHWT